jgi:hypothetical protein
MACNARLIDLAIRTNGPVFRATYPPGCPGRGLGSLDPSPTSDPKTAVAGRGLGGRLET